MNELRVTILVAFGLSALVAGAATVRARRFPDPEVRRGLTWLLALTAVWAALEAGRLLLSLGEAFAHAAYVGGLVVGLASVGVWLYFCSAYAGLAYHRDRGLLALGGGLYIAVIAVKLTNPIHGAYYRLRVADQPFPHLAVDPGLAHWLVVGLVYVLVLAGFVAMWRTFRRSRVETTGLWLLSLAALLPLVPEVLAAITVGLLPGLNYEPVGVAVFAIGVLYAVSDEFVAVGGVARRQVVDDIASAVVVVDRERRVVDHNAAAASLFPSIDAGAPVSQTDEAVADYLERRVGTAEESDGDPPASTERPGGADGDRGREAVTGSIGYDTDGERTGETPFDGDESVITVERDGQCRHLLARAVRVAVGDRTIGWAVVLSDVTELEARRRELERQNEQLDDFAEALTHELRNPLSVVHGYVEVLEDGDQTAATSDRALREIRGAAERMTTVVDELTTLADRGKTVTDVGDHRLGEIVDGIEHDDDIVVAADGVVTGNDVRLQEILSNLLGYARTEGAGGVTAAVERDRLVVSLRGDLDIGDTRRLLQYGHAGGGEETRLSLANVRALARAHGWTVAVERGPESRPGDEVTFVFGGVETGPDAPAASGQRQGARTNGGAAEPPETGTEREREQERETRTAGDVSAADVDGDGTSRTPGA